MRGDKHVPDDLEGLLRVAGRARPQPRTAGERRRTTSRIAKLGAASLAVGLFGSMQGVALACAIGAVSLGAVGTGIYLSSRADRAPHAHASARATAPVAAALPDDAHTVEAAVDAPVVDVPPATEAVDDAPAPRARREQRPLDAEREHQLLDRAFAITARDPAAAMALVREHAASFPHGELVAERELVAVDALSRLGRTREARARAQSLLRRFPDSIYRERVQHMLEEMP